jgi:hypothetical protein
LENKMNTQRALEWLYHPTIMAKALTMHINNLSDEEGLELIEDFTADIYPSQRMALVKSTMQARGMNNAAFRLYVCGNLKDRVSEPGFFEFHERLAGEESQDEEYLQDGLAGESMGMPEGLTAYLVFTDTGMPEEEYDALCDKCRDAGLTVTPIRHVLGAEIGIPWPDDRPNDDYFLKVQFI